MSWAPDTTGDSFAANTDGFEPDNAGFEPDNAADATADNWNGEGDTAPAEGDGAGEGARRCRNCDQIGHISRECPEPKKLTGECFNCGEVGHNKADCPNPKVARPFTGECRICQKEGHPAAECPDKPADKCRICGQEGHKAIDCKSKRTDIFPTSLPWDSADIAWQKMIEADTEKDMDGFKTAFLSYAKALMNFTSENDAGAPGIDLADIEKGFRVEGRNMHLIAKERQIPDTMTIISFSGIVDQKYVLTFNWTAKPRARKFAEGWPSTPEENLERLGSCGFPYDRLIPKCENCGEMGHIRKHCKQERAEAAGRIEVRCYICDEIGHRARDCEKERADPFACRNCKQPGHKSSDCPEPRSADGVECRRCGETGHFSRDCPNNTGPPPRTCRNCGEEGHMAKECDKPKNPANTMCRNCDEVGHFSRDCPKPRDWSKVTCRNCGENGHGAARCPKPPAENDGFEEVRFDQGDKSGATAAEGGWDNSGADGSRNGDTNGGSGGGWAKTGNAADAAVSSGGW